MNSFSISELEQFSGIKAHTIRIWEQRYNALKPTRSEGNTRYYDSNQLRRLLNIVSLMESDFKISELCKMNDEELIKILNEQLKTNVPNDEKIEYFISQLIAAGMSFDEQHFDKIFSNCLLRLGITNTYIKVIYPMLTRMGLMWVTGSLSPGYEHFICNIIKQKLYTAIDALPPAKANSDCWFLFLPENEFHELGLLCANFIIRKSGQKVIYLGANSPFDSLINAVTVTPPSHLLCFFVNNDVQENTQHYLNELIKNFGTSTIHISGNAKLISQLKTEKQVNWTCSVEELEQLLK